MNILASLQLEWLKDIGLIIYGEITWTTQNSKLMFLYL